MYRSFPCGAMTLRLLCSSTPKHKVTPLNRFILKLTRTVDPVPTEVSFQTMDKAHSRFRIGLTTAIMLFSIVGSWIAIRQGKHAVEMGGESVYDKNRQRYQDESDTKQ